MRRRRLHAPAPGRAAAPGRGGPATTGWDAGDEEPRGDTGFPLFAPPARWEARHRGARRPLPRHSYVLTFRHYVSGDSCHGIVEFTTEQVARLRPGQVSADGRAMSPGAFERLARDAC
ncbi:hypothetical protein [Streptomyces echinatus]|uniref:Uncharacterized protein n=1 Tax=Streptomyces echinatus TaxID=67293 RepID=A0A7W9PYQ6_9ACTN|nr:hypothetical protein [Streptomyces echinatus]MBB5930246.1 hypothetical protein [Streptomyces echinatus]